MPEISLGSALQPIAWWFEAPVEGRYQVRVELYNGVYLFTPPLSVWRSFGSESGLVPARFPVGVHAKVTGAVGAFAPGLADNGAGVYVFPPGNLIAWCMIYLDCLAGEKVGVSVPGYVVHLLGDVPSGMGVPTWCVYDA